MAAAGATLVALGLAAVLLFWPMAHATVPDVASRPQGAAVSALRDKGFDVKVATAHSDTVPVGQTISTSPGAGSSETKGSEVTLTVSTGPAMVTLPSLVHGTLDDAKKKLTALGLPSPTVTMRPDVSAAGTVLSMTPTATNSVRHDSTVALVVSSGPQQFDLPDVVDTDEATARQKLESAGLTVTTKKEHSSDHASGTVISTNPSSGTEVKTGDSVEMVVSQGVEMVDVPDVTGMSGSDARSKLEDAGFSVDGGSWLDDLLNHTVTSQTPAGGAGHQAPKGSSVELSF